MSSWWNSASTSNFTRGITSITGQLSTNLKDILTEASEETYDPNAELTRARQQVEDLELSKQTLIEECTSLKKQCDELIIDKQSVEIKSEMLLAESRRTMEEKDNELKRLRENPNSGSWSNTNDPQNTWTDILEDDQPEMSEYLKYQRTIRELKEENIHLRDEMSNLRKTIKSQQAEKKQSRQDEELHQTYSEQITKLRQEYEDQLQKLRSRIEELEQWNANQQEEELRKSIEVQKDVDDVDKDLLSQELEQANSKLNWYNEKFKESSDLQSKFDSLSSQNEQLESELQTQLQTISQLKIEIEQFTSTEQTNKLHEEELTRLLNEERQRCDALANDNDSMLRLAEETRKQNENLFDEQLNNKNQAIEQLNSQIDHLKNHQEELNRHFETEKNELLIRITKQKEDEDLRRKDAHQREILEKQIIELNEDLQTLENEKNDLNEQVEQLKEQLQSKDRQIQSIQTSGITPGSPSALSSSPDTRTRSPSPQTFEHLLELEAQVLRYEDQFHELHSIYDRFVTLLPIEIPSLDNHQQSLAEQFTNLFEQWSTYVDTLSITQQESDSLRQLLIEKQDDLEKLQSDLDLTTSKLIEFQQTNRSLEENEEEIEQILELHPFPQRAPSRQSLISSTPGEKQQLIAQNELLSSLLAEKDRELISLQQAEKTREELVKNLENLKTNFQQIEIDRETKENELNDIKNVLDEKIRENSSLKKEKMYFIDKLAELERNRQEQHAIMPISPKQLTQDEEKPPSSPTTKQTSNLDEDHTKEEYDKLRTDYDQLVEFSKRQHDESLSYYNEYSRILGLHNELNSKSSQLQIDYESLQSLIQQKNEAFLQCQNELNNYQNLLYHEKKKSEEIDLLRSTLIERENKLQQLISHETELLLKQSEVEREMKLLEQNNFELKSVEQSFVEQMQQMQENHVRGDQKDSEIQQQKISQFEEREKKLANELERLRTHLLKMEESYTNDLLTAEDREKTLRNQVGQLEDTNKGQHELIQQLNTLGEQSKQTLATELAALKHEYSKLETNHQNLNNQLQYQLKCSQNLQNVLEQFKREREQHINEHLRQYQDALREQTSIVTRLTAENNEIRTRLADFNAAISAAQRLNDQLEKKDLLISTLRNDLLVRSKQIQQYEENLRDLQSTSGSRVEKQLVKNILLSYFHTPVDKRQEVVPLLGALVGFTLEEYRTAINALANNSHQQGGRVGWLSGWLGGNQAQASLTRTRTQSETPAYDPNKSFTELLIQYVDQQSPNANQQPTAKFNTDEYLHRYDNSLGGNHSTRKPSLSASANPFVNTTHLSLNKPPTALVLPTVNNPPPSSTTTKTTDSDSSSSTLLKDLLKS